MTTTIDALKAIFDGQPLTTTPDPVLKEELRAKLRTGIWRVDFTKVDGSTSTMECTLDPRHLPPGDPQDAGTKAADNPTVLRVYAVDREGWRSFKVLNVNSAIPIA